jgi:hypothetical protein
MINEELASRTDRNRLGRLDCDCAEGKGKEKEWFASHERR